jgi:hypothetical protein
MQSLFSLQSEDSQNTSIGWNDTYMGKKTQNNLVVSKPYKIS